MKNQPKYFLLNKPYGVLTQFTDKENRPTLSSLYKFPKDVYPVGRLDLDSEGLLLLTNDKSLTNFLLNPKFKHEREYYVQVEGIPTEEAIKKLCDGVIIENRKTLPAKVKLIEDPNFEKRNPPIRERKNIPTSWLSITIYEGRNRQVRRMTAAVGYPTLRLVRVRIENLFLGNLKSGEVRKLTTDEIKQLKESTN
ncbi:pseudouridine synthase [Stygiobacter electus]|uniref:Pseudouridine synthase n=1 Tax=Stygiobacter electus TaxID=3032292 RepID=A0AAE3NZ06_9BACT|nr:pseudouridine synthase [Stygiobacter electus]MDF1611337.1 pseudouridine synthase [Stygiobacter electus]